MLYLYFLSRLSTLFWKKSHIVTFLSNLLLLNIEIGFSFHSPVYQKEVNFMQSFIVEHYLQKDVDVYCGGPDTFQGTVEACADGVLTLKKETRFTHISIDKIIAIWAK